MRITASIAVLAAMAALGASAAVAGGQSRGHGQPDGGYVTAESRFGHGTVSGPVRLARAGNYEVMLPGGTWISCGRSCAETLRVESVDFWENKGAGKGNRIDNECGLFGCLGRSYRF
jgi:hypothetical protein